MKNIDYLEVFFRKHSLSGKIKVKYQKPYVDDDYMSDIVFENGDVVNIHDIIFDIESEFAPDVFGKWFAKHKENGISYKDWIQSDNHYVPDVDTSSVRDYQMEMEGVIQNMKDAIDKVLNMEIDDEDEDSDYEEYEEGEVE